MKMIVWVWCVSGFVLANGLAADDIQEPHRRIQRAAASRAGTGRTVNLQPVDGLKETEISAEDLASILRRGQTQRKLDLSSRNLTPQERRTILVTDPAWPWIDYRSDDRSMQAGRIPQCRIVQVIGKDTLIVSPDAATWLWVEGFSTTGAADDDDCSFTTPVIISGTKQYTTTGGATKTVLSLRPLVCKQDVLEDAKKLAKKPAKKPTAKGKGT